jgi:phenylacetate-CoA ligase
MEKVTGRVDDMIILRGVNVFPTQIEERLLAVEGLAPHFQIELSRDGRMDQMTVLVEATPNAADETSRNIASAALIKSIKDTIGISAKVTVTEPNSVARSEGKAKRVIDLRQV